MPIRLDGSTGITVGTAVTVGTSDVKIGSNVNIDTTRIVGVSTIGVTTAYVTSINDGPISGTRNLIINGGFDVWQRGTSFTTNAAYTADRWWFVNDAVGTATVTRQDISSQGLGSQYCLRAERSVGTNRWVIGTNLETSTVKSILGKTITLSFYMRKGSALTSNVAISFGTSGTEAKFGSLIDYSNFTVLASDLSTTTFKKYSTSVNVGAASTALGLKVEFSADQAGASNAYFEIAQVQVEEGPVATPFERRSYGQELALCHRYYQSFRYVVFRSADTSGAQTYWETSHTYHVPFRASPTLTFTSPNSGVTGVIERWGGVNMTVSSATNDTANLAYVILSSAVSSTASAQAHITASSEL